MRWHLGKAQDCNKLLLAQRLPHLLTLHENELRHAAPVDDEAATKDFNALGFCIAAVWKLLVLEDGLADGEEDEREEE